MSDARFERNPKKRRPRILMQGRAPLIDLLILLDLNPSAAAPMAMTTAGLAPAILLAFLPPPVILHDAQLQARIVLGLAAGRRPTRSAMRLAGRTWPPKEAPSTSTMPLRFASAISEAMASAACAPARTPSGAGRPDRGKAAAQRCPWRRCAGSLWRAGNSLKNDIAPSHAPSRAYAKPG